MSDVKFSGEPEKSLKNLVSDFGIGDFMERLETSLKDESGEFRKVNCKSCKQMYTPKSLLEYDTCTLCGTNNFEYDWTKW